MDENETVEEGNVEEKGLKKGRRKGRQVEDKMEGQTGKKSKRRVSRKIKSSHGKLRETKDGKKEQYHDGEFQGISISFLMGFLKRVVKGLEYVDVKLFVSLDDLEGQVEPGETLRLIERVEEGRYTGLSRQGWVMFYSCQVQKKPRSEWTLADLLLFCIAPGAQLEKKQKRSARQGSRFIDSLPPPCKGVEYQGVFLSCAETCPVVDILALLETLQRAVTPESRFVWIRQFCGDHLAAATEYDMMTHGEKVEKFHWTVHEALQRFSRHLLFVDAVSPECTKDLHVLWDLYLAKQANVGTVLVFPQLVNDRGELGPHYEALALAFGAVDVGAVDAASDEAKCGVIRDLISAKLDDRAFNERIRQYLAELLVDSEFGEPNNRNINLPKGKKNKKKAWRLSRFISYSAFSNRRIVKHNSLQDKAQRLEEAGVLLSSKKLFRASLVHFQKQLQVELEADRWGGNGLRTPAAERNIGNTLRELGEYGMAMEYLARALENSTKSDEESDERKAMCFEIMLSQGDTLRKQESLNAAVERYLAARKYLEDASLQDPLRTATVIERLGMVSELQGDTVHALELLRQVAKIQGSTLGQSAPELGRTLNRMANLLVKQGRLDQAERYLFQAQAIWRQNQEGSYSCARTREHVVYTLTLLGKVCHQKGDRGGAQRMLQDAQEMEPFNKEMLHFAGAFYRSVGNYREAVRAYSNLLPADLQRCRMEHVQTLNDLGNIFFTLENVDVAETFHRRALELKISSGEENTSLAVSLNALAVVLKNQGRFKEALTLYEKARDVAISSLGSEHLQVADTLENMSLLYEAMGEIEKATELEQECLTVRKKSLPVSHAATQKAYVILTRLRITHDSSNSSNTA